MPLYISTVGRVVCDKEGCGRELVIEDCYGNIILDAHHAGWWISEDDKVAACPEHKEEMRAKGEGR